MNSFSTSTKLLLNQTLPFRRIITYLSIFWFVISFSPKSVFAQTGAVSYVHDPCIIKSEGDYYIFSTGDRIEMRRSVDLQYWTRLNQVFKSIPEWGSEQVPGVSNIWAPDIYYRDSTYYLYYSLSTFGSNLSIIGLAANKTLDPNSQDYNWVDQGKVIGSNGGNNYNAIDPNIAEDQDGRLWLSFGSFWSGIKLVELDSTTMKPFPNATLHSIARRSGVGAVEAPFIVFKNGYYYLFVSFDSCCNGVNSTYKIMVGRSNEITGPYKDRNNVLMTSGGGSLILKGDERWKGPGHCAVLLEDENNWLVHHAYDALSNGRPTLRIKKMIWDEENWPILEVPTSIQEGSKIKSDKFMLSQNYPNPFNPSTVINYTIPNVASGFSLSKVMLKIYDILGQEVTTLVNEIQEPGNYQVTFDASNLSSGIYYYTFKSGDFQDSKKMVLIE